MKSLPLPVRLAAGLAVTAVERARELPGQLVGLPVTIASQALQASMRVQQQVTELAIRGDEVLAALRPAEDSPEWATFDEDIDEYDDARPAFDRVAEDSTDDADAVDDDLAPEPEPAPIEDEADEDGAAEEAALEAEAAGDDPWEQERKAIAGAPAAVPNYDELSLPQLRARLRGFSVADLEELLAYERAGENRPSFTGMLARRIETVREQQK
ncbi:lipid droplet-associated protein [Actinokineospora pegani]|uniref:lipid droplet-associated protein n=1 Tax=Actinokineospora pegani TaxID=2654637 RepID=UPI0012EAD008|nr:lipid droplet-associated protein [Actinokineospora pegani]